MTLDQDRWAQFCADVARHLEQFLDACEGGPEPSELAAKDLLMQTYAIQVEARNERLHQLGFEKPTEAQIELNRAALELYR